MGCFSSLGLSFKTRKSGPIEHSTKQITELHHSEPPSFTCTSCNFSYGDESKWWTFPPVYSEDSPQSSRPESISPGTSRPVDTVEATLDALNPDLRKLSMQIHDNPELMWEEHYAHDVLTAFMESHGFTVTRHYLHLSTAWRAEYTHTNASSTKKHRTIGVNSEMDALSIGGKKMHACGHNLIAIAGCAVAIALQAALKEHNVSGTVVLLGTPAEEGGGGKVVLMDKGAYDDMDACFMCHPGPGPAHSVDTGSSTAMQGFDIEYFGQSAHAGAAPWDGINALDAAFLAYSAISVLRQQTKPDHRVQGVITNNNFVANIIPDYASMRWYIRAPTVKDLVPFAERVRACFESAALATGCRLVIKPGIPYDELRQNSVLASEFVSIVAERYKMPADTQGTSASVDFGNITYKLPSFHPIYSIPTLPHGGNHTPAFAKSAALPEAHKSTMDVSKGLAMTAWRVLVDDDFFAQVEHEFKFKTPQS